MEFGGNNSTLIGLHLFSSRSSPVQEVLAVKIIKFVLYALVFIIGFGGNSIVIWIMFKKKKARTFHNILLCNLAAADIALLSINLPFRLAYQENDYVWPFGQFLCKVIPMFTYLFLTASSLTLVAISFERYRTIRSVKVISEVVSTPRKLQVVLLWVVSCVITLPLNIFLNVVHHKGRPVCTDVWPSETLEKAYFTGLFIIQFLLPTIVMVVLYIKVGMILRATRFKLRRLGLLQNRNRHKKTIRMICIIVIVYIALTLPYHITWQMSTYGIKNALAKKFSVLVLTATSASHPIIYGALHQEFAQGFKAFLRCSKKARTDFTSASFRKLSLTEKFELVSNRKIDSLQEDSSSIERVQIITVL
ncbi:somatostatin receptor type 2-like [Dendronephthya gigantea]|uniref:somatostatin receptor type 2-like n=1 Tax=Dendronephthya gigantea TaxID=151771 RepID=UPI00106D2BCF|nr:somatostatin receptor type 2-like [Dendronephthya gigantea]